MNLPLEESQEPMILSSFKEDPYQGLALTLNVISHNVLYNALLHVRNTSACDISKKLTKLYTKKLTR